MFLLLDTSTMECKMLLYEGGRLVARKQWQSNRQLARDVLAQLELFLQEQQHDFSSLAGLGVFRGPGSFTGLRIGVTVMNTLADALSIAIVGALGESWQSEVVAALSQGDNSHIVLPEYGSMPHITQPKK